MLTHRYVRWSAKGRSLVELLAVMGVLAMLVSAAVPVFGEVVANYRRQAAVSSLYAHLSLARQTAIARAQRVTVRAAPGGWQDGWQVFIDANADGEVNPDEEVLAVGDRRLAITISANGVMARYVSFDASGLPTQLNGAFLSGRFTICAPGKTPVDELVLSAAGRLRQARIDRSCPL